MPSRRIHGSRRPRWITFGQQIAGWQKKLAAIPLQRPEPPVRCWKRAASRPWKARREPTATTSGPIVSKGPQRQLAQTRPLKMTGRHSKLSSQTIYGSPEYLNETRNSRRCCANRCCRWSTNQWSRRKCWILFDDVTLPKRRCCGSTPSL